MTSDDNGDGKNPCVGERDNSSIEEKLSNNSNRDNSSGDITIDLEFIERKLRNEVSDWKNRRKNATRNSTRDSIYQVIDNGCLLVGSQHDIASGSHLIKKYSGASQTRIVATDDPFVAQVNALISNFHSQVYYGGAFGSNHSPKQVFIGALQPFTIVPQGIIYIVQRQGFANFPAGSRIYTINQPVQYLPITIPITITDFPYPIISRNGEFRIVHDPEGFYGQKVIYNPETTMHQLPKPLKNKKYLYPANHKSMP